MKKPVGRLIFHIILGAAGVALCVSVVALVRCRWRDVRAEDIWAGYRQEAQYGDLIINYPLDETLFPPEIAPVTFRWQDSNSKSDTWLVRLEFGDNELPLDFLTHQPQWTPGAQQWEAIKKRSLEKPAQVTVTGVNRRTPREILSSGRISIKTSGDPVGAAIFYREVNLPFVDAVKDPSNIRWRFGSVSSPEQPPVVLKNMPVCGNCHSFTRDAGILGMDVDYANSKGSYVITKTSTEMTLATSDIITWNDYKKQDGEQTFGLLSQVSPDGRYVVSTVKDKSVFVPKPGIEFSQLFFPIKGILCIYDRQKRTFESLPGADDPNYVQSNATWSPDGRYIVFARARAYSLKHTRGKGKILLTPEECREFLEDGKPFSFDLYRIAFNNGEGDKAEPVEGASNNGMSNFFARYSPNGKWIVFCRAKNYMLLQPDSELYIIPAEGGEARKLRCNTARMNSWHSWSPNGRWLVFSSKVNTAYTQLLLTHIDEQGRSTPPVLLEHFTCPDRAANIPEFVNAESTAIKKISEHFLDDYSFVRAGNEFFRHNEADSAIAEYRTALQMNPDNFEANLKLGFLLYNVKGRLKEGMSHLTRALQLNPDDPRVHHDIGMALLHQRQFDRAVKHLSEALRRMPQGLDEQYNPANMHCRLGQALLYCRRPDEADVHLRKAVQLNPDFAEAHYNLALLLANRGNIDDCVSHYSKAVQLDSGVDTSAELHYLIAINYAGARDFSKAVGSAKKALSFARASGDKKFAEEIRRWIELYKEIDNSTGANNQ